LNLRVLRAFAALLLLAPGAAAADEGDIPAGKFGLYSGVRQNIGDLADRYGWGYVLGIEAHYHPTRPGQSLSLGLAWSTTFGRFGAEMEDTVDTPMRLVEMSLGLRLRRSLSENVPRFAVVSAGGTVLRTSVPVPPDEERLYLGAYAGIGYEQFVLGRNLLTVDARYGLVGTGPASVTVVAGLGFAQGSSKAVAFASIALFIAGALFLQNI
jgi:hypothetical protein